jgi:hypothetical protein
MIGKLAEYVYRYLFAAGSSVVLLAAGPFSARHRRMLNELAHHFGYRAPGAPVPVLPTVALGRLVPANAMVFLREPHAHDGNVTLLELWTIASVTRALAPRASFEIGTFNGRTALNLAANSPPGAVTYTLDLPAEEIDAARLPIEVQERRFVMKPVSGELIARSGAGLTIEQLYGDSAAFDFEPYRGAIDLVFVDGSHSYEYVLNDSARALEMIGGRGIVLWHDYGGFPGVTRALDELYREGGVWAGLR